MEPKSEAGMIYQSQRGYPEVYMPEHPRARPSGRVFVHLLVAEKALGRPLPPAVVVHHWTEDKQNTRDLVLCENQAYHLLLHRRQRALSAGHPAHFLWCYFCRRFDDPANMQTRRNGQAHHLACAAVWQRTYQRGRGRRTVAERVTERAAETHCRHGHEWTPGNTRTNKRGHRICRTCESWPYRHGRAGR